MKQEQKIASEIVSLLLERHPEIKTESFCNDAREIIAFYLNELKLTALEAAAQQLESDAGPGIEGLPNELPGLAMKNAARDRLGLWKSNIRALASKVE